MSGMADQIEIPPVYPGDWNYGSTMADALDAAEIKILSGPHLAPSNTREEGS